MLQLDLILFSPREFQDIVDYGQESLTAFPDTFDVLFLLGGQGLVQEDA